MATTTPDAAVTPTAAPTAKTTPAPRDATPAHRLDRALLVGAVTTAALVVAMYACSADVNVVLQAQAPAFADPDLDLWTSGLTLAILLTAAVAVIWRERRHPVGWLLLLLCVLSALIDVTEAVAVLGLHVPGRAIGDPGVWAAVSESAQRPQFTVVLWILLLFPTGRSPSPRWRPLTWVIGVISVGWFLDHLLRAGRLEESPFPGLRNPLAQSWLHGPVTKWVFLPAAAGCALLVVVAVIRRFRVSRGDERQQLKWVGLVAGLVPLGVVGLLIGGFVGPAFMNVAGDVIWLATGVGLPIAVAVAITRYRLYDLDLLVNRTLVYGTLTLVVAGTYALVILLATRLVANAGWDSPTVITVATLAAVAVASPARRTVQEAVDRAFNVRAWAADHRLTSLTSRWVEESHPAAALRDVLASVLRDDDLEIAYWIRRRSVYATSEGRDVALPGPGSGRCLLSLDARGGPLAVVLHDAALERDRRLLAVVRRSAPLLAETARLEAESLEQLTEVAASRARLVDAADQARRRVERDLHDGAQQRLVGLTMLVRAARRTAPNAQHPLLDSVIKELQATLGEIRELARGIHPAALDSGLDAALETLVAKLPISVTLSVLPDRLPQRVELTAYYVVCEAITNSLKYARASALGVTAERVAEEVVLDVWDDGCGGAAVRAGGGLAGLVDRVAASAGTWAITSPPGQGTRITVRLPCAS